MKKPIILLLLVVLAAIGVNAQSFDECFNDSTLRLDYVFAGNNHDQQIFFEKACVTPRWAGRKGRLADVPLKGNGQLIVKDHETGQTLYVHTFSTLFQEWQATEEATQVNRAFETSYNVPMPKRSVDVTVTLTDFHGKVVASMTHKVDPTDILIRRMGPNGVPFHYVWKRQTLPVEEKTADSPGLRNYMPSEGPIGGEPDITSCIDLAIVAEGYTHAQMGKFYNDCQRAVDALFAREPFKSLKNRFNVVAVAAESLDGGPSVPHLGRWRNTAVSTNYDTFYSDRYLTTRDIHHL